MGLSFLVFPCRFPTPNLGSENGPRFRRSTTPRTVKMDECKMMSALHARAWWRGHCAHDATCSDERSALVIHAYTVRVSHVCVVTVWQTVWCAYTSTCVSDVHGASVQHVVATYELLPRGGQLQGLEGCTCRGQLMLPVSRAWNRRWCSSRLRVTSRPSEVASVKFIGVEPLAYRQVSVRGSVPGHTFEHNVG